MSWSTFFASKDFLFDRTIYVDCYPKSCLFSLLMVIAHFSIIVKMCKIKAFSDIENEC